MKGLKERPILFTPENVRKIFAGEKWQTRRIVGAGLDPYVPTIHTSNNVPSVSICYVQPGDRLWVRESLYEQGGQWFYRSDNAPVLVDPSRQAESVAWAHHKTTSYASAIHMPRWAARLFLNVTDVRRERIQDISHDDMRAEGVRPKTETSLLWRESLTERFRQLWDEINGDRGFGWEVNPWVWAIDFKVVQA